MITMSVFDLSCRTSSWKRSGNSGSNRWIPVSQSLRLSTSNQ